MRHLAPRLSSLLFAVLTVAAAIFISLSPAAAESWQALPLKVPGGEIREIRQDGERAFVHAGGRWLEIESCAEHRFCFTPRNPPKQRKAPASGLPDGKVASRTTSFGPVSAWYEKPTKAYAHAILGDAVEAASLVVMTPDGKQLTIAAGKGHVFEDLTPRLADLDGDGDNEVITIRSNFRKGAAVVVYGFEDGALKLLAATPPVGLAHRWRNPSVIVEDPDGSGHLIGEVVTPHIGGTLKLWALTGSPQSGFRMEPRGSAGGFSNHAIGSRQLGLSGVRGSTVAVPSADRHALRILEITTNGLKSVDFVRVPRRISHAVGTISENGNPLFLAGLDDGRLFTVGLPNNDYYCVTNRDQNRYFMVAEDRTGKRREFLAAPGRHWCVPRNGLETVWVFENQDALEGCSHLVGANEAGLDLVRYTSFDNCRWAAK